MDIIPHIISHSVEAVADTMASEEDATMEDAVPSPQDPPPPSSWPKNPNPKEPSQSDVAGAADTGSTARPNGAASPPGIGPSSEEGDFGTSKAATATAATAPASADLEPSSNEADAGGRSGEGGTATTGTAAASEASASSSSLAARRAAEARAVAEATASADAAYVPSPSLLTSPSPFPLLHQVDGPSLKGYNQKESVYQAKCVPVPLRGRLDVPIHIGSGGSVVEYTVETNNYDIAFGITAEREEGVTIVTESARVNCHLKPVSGKFLVGSVPCAIVFSFDNEYSWFREKQVTYKIIVTPPSQENVIAGRRRRAKAALKAVADDLLTAETRLAKASTIRAGLAAEVARMEKELEEKRKSLDVAEKEEGWLKERVKLRKAQDNMLQKRLKVGWDDEKAGEHSSASEKPGNDSYAKD